MLSYLRLRAMAVGSCSGDEGAAAISSWWLCARPRRHHMLGRSRDLFQAFVQEFLHHSKLPA